MFRPYPSIFPCQLCEPRRPCSSGLHPRLSNMCWGQPGLHPLPWRLLGIWLLFFYALLLKTKFQTFPNPSSSLPAQEHQVPVSAPCLLEAPWPHPVCSLPTSLSAPPLAPLPHSSSSLDVRPCKVLSLPAPREPLRGMGGCVLCAVFLAGPPGTFSLPSSSSAF